MDNQEVQQSPGAKPGFFYGYIVVVASLVIMVVSWGTFFAFGVFFKPVLTEFGWTRAMLSGAYSLSMLMRGLLGIVMGGLTDRFGPRMVLTLCGFLAGIGYLLMSQIGAIWQLYLFYGVIVGIGMSGVWVPLLSTIVRWFTKRRGIMSGIVLAGSSAGGLIAPLVANQLISTYDWRISYIILGILVLVVVILAAQFLRRDPARMGQVPYGESNEGEHGLKLGIEGFSLKEAVGTRQFWIVFVMTLCYGFLMFTVVVHIAPHATDLGISAASAATILATTGGLAIVGRVVFGNIADRIGNKQALIIGSILTVAALFWLVPATEVWRLYLFAAVFGFSQGGMGVIQSPLIAGLFGLDSHGLILGVTSFGFNIGGAVGPFLAGYIFDVTGSYQVAFLISAAIAIIGLILALFLTPIRGERGKRITI